mmetsp:Transcript_24017/g.42635  ORF Transcript_24017/g.42635 Transcript_24017/m.42635 type:complete len:850 (+) Transcript_24017:12-2561(+)
MAAVGEVMLCGPETAGKLLSLTRFNGTPVSALGGGFNKLFVVEAGGKIYSLERSSLADTAASADIDVEIYALDNLGPLKQVVCGRAHTLLLTQDGLVLSSGQGVFGILGHGGTHETKVPLVIKVLSDKSVRVIACGEYHSLALTDRGDLYSWGRGFEGQLGIREDVLAASTPKYIDAFRRKKVEAIACGYTHSLAICEGRIYSWGEGRSGQLGTGKTRQRNVPQVVDVIGEDNAQETLVSCSAGFAHSIAMTAQGDLYSWGLNNYGQLGVGDFVVRWKATAVKRDLVGISLKPLKQISCGAYTTFVIDDQGSLYSWGRGYIGHKHETLEDTPRKVEHNTENRKFTGIFSSDHSSLFFAPLRIFSISPFCGPVSGGTRLSLIGTAFASTENLRVKFLFNDTSVEAGCEYDYQSNSLLCLTPEFEVEEAHQIWPAICDMDLTMDGENYVRAEHRFLIYSNDIYPTSVNPRCASVTGGTDLALTINLDQFAPEWLWHLTIGFLPKPKLVGLNKSGNTQLSTPMNKLNEDSQISGFSERANDQPHTTEADWRLTAAKYHKGKVICKVPALYEFDESSMVYMIDLAINGQQFTGHSLNFRYYDVGIYEVIPLLGSSAENTVIKIIGRGLYDSTAKKVRVKNEYGEREVQVLWDHKAKIYMCTVPPLSWLFGEALPDSKTLSEAARAPLNMELTLNGIDYIELPSFRYIDVKVLRISKAKFDPALKPDQILDIWHSPDEPLIEDDEQRQKRETEEAQELLVPVRPGAKLYIWVEEVIMTPDLTAAFIHESNVTTTAVIFKNPQKIGVEVPNVGEFMVPTDIAVELSQNGQKFSQNGKTFKYLGATAPEEQPKKRR